MAGDDAVPFHAFARLPSPALVAVTALLSQIAYGALSNLPLFADKLSKIVSLFNDL